MCEESLTPQKPFLAKIKGLLKYYCSIALALSRHPISYIQTSRGIDKLVKEGYLAKTVINGIPQFRLTEKGIKWADEHGQ